MTFEERKEWLVENHRRLLEKENRPIEGNGIYERYENPVLTAEHAPLNWRYDFDPQRNPFLMERIGVHAVLNAGAIKWQGRYVLVARVEGNDRKSFFAVAESPNGVDNFRFWDRPITLPEYGEPATNVYDMRLTAHEDGWIYGIFCVERKDHSAEGDLSAATATAGIARTIRSSLAGNMPSTRVRRTDLLTRAAAAASAGRSWTAWSTRSSRRKRSSTAASTIPSRK